MSVLILAGDVRARLRWMAPESVQCVVTSPPYWGLRDYKAEGQIGLEPSPLHWVAVMVDVFREIRRVLRKDGVVWLNVGDKYAGSGCGGDTGYSGLEGSTEGQEQSKIKGRSRDEIAATQRNGAVTNFGRRALREGIKAGRPEGLKERPHTSGFITKGFRDKQRLMLPARLALALQDDDWWIRDEIVWHKPNPMPSSTADRTTPAHEMLYLLTKSPAYFFDAVAIAEPATYDGPNAPEKIKSPHGQGFTRAAATPSGWDQENARHDQGEYRGRRSGNKQRVEAEDRGSPNSHVAASVPWEGGLTRNKRSVWSISTEPCAEAHFATFPTKLVEPCILAGTSQRGACAGCGAPWRRVLRQSFVSQPDVSPDKGMRGAGDQKPLDESNGRDGYPRGLSDKATLGWYPTCGCYDLPPIPKQPRREPGEGPAAWRDRRPAAMKLWEAEAAALLEPARSLPTRPCVVLDPFLGSGTAALVADRLGRDAIGIEINGGFVEMARQRITADAPLVADVQVSLEAAPR